MADYTISITGLPNAINPTLSGTNHDDVLVEAFGQDFTIVLLNRDPTNTIWFRCDGSAALTDESDGNIPIFPKSSVQFDVEELPTGSLGLPLSVVGNSDPYSVIVLPKVYSR